MKSIVLRLMLVLAALAIVPDAAAATWFHHQPNRPRLRTHRILPAIGRFLN
jgi:hypothetical protein